jgi:hypothetical protein
MITTRLHKAFHTNAHGNPSAERSTRVPVCDNTRHQVALSSASTSHYPLADIVQLPAEPLANRFFSLAGARKGSVTPSPFP